MITEPPVINCAPLAAFAATDLDDVRRAFAEASPVSMQQAWLGEAESTFAPAVVRTGWRDDALLVFAELTDTDVTTSATREDQNFCLLGDAFEVFLRPVRQESYVEFHVAPNNLRLHLRFPDAGWRQRVSAADAFAKAVVLPPAFESRTWVRAEAREWCVLALIPVASVCEHVRPLAGSEWRFSFSRYDYTRGTDAPVISSTSPHAEPSFHRLQEWGMIRFRL